MGCVLSAGGSLRWHRDVICGEEAAAARRQGMDPYAVMLAEAAKIPAGSENLLFLPYLMGERTPYPDPFVRGAFLGLSTRHGRAHMTRALLEGVVFALRDCLAAIREKDIVIREIRATGGGARSPFWLQMMADAFGLPVTRVENPECGASGAAILAGIGVGVHGGFAEAAHQAVRLGATARPRKAASAVYEACYQRYRSVYPAIEGLFPRG